MSRRSPHTTPIPVWRIPVLLMLTSAIALGVGLFFDGFWDLLGSLLLVLPVLSFTERWYRRERAKT